MPKDSTPTTLLRICGQKMDGWLMKWKEVQGNHSWKMAGIHLIDEKPGKSLQSCHVPKWHFVDIAGKRKYPCVWFSAILFLATCYLLKQLKNQLFKWSELNICTCHMLHPTGWELFRTEVWRFSECSTFRGHD